MLPELIISTSYDRQRSRKCGTTVYCHIFKFSISSFNIHNGITLFDIIIVFLRIATFFNIQSFIYIIPNSNISSGNQLCIVFTNITFVFLFTSEDIIRQYPVNTKFKKFIFSTKMMKYFLSYLIHLIITKHV